MVAVNKNKLPLLFLVDWDGQSTMAAHFSARYGALSRDGIDHWGAESLRFLLCS